MTRKREVGDLYRPNAYIRKLEGNIPVIIEIRGRKYILKGYKEEKKNH